MSSNSNSTSNDVGNKPFSSKKILVVEDNLLNQKVARLFLEDMGYKVDIAANGKQALEMFNQDYDAVLMDIGLPDMDGYEISIEIRKIDKTVPIIAYTASGDESKCLEAGMNEFTAKPIMFDELKAVLAKYL
jgi:CheY-like chemotaxis protein